MYGVLEKIIIFEGFLGLSFMLEYNLFDFKLIRFVLVLLGYTIKKVKF
jgi:hypothetical protein